jgi:cellulose synthase/poly-beta-1,6-N-acetylglucosamine synthase-like glycosyltransferase
MIIFDALLIFLIVSIWFLIYGLSVSFKTKKVVLHRYSIIIACRNEEKNIPDLIESLDLLDYPKDKFEAVIVSDASEDKTFDLLQAYSKTRNYLKVFHLNQKSKEYMGKKAALKFAIEQSSYEQFIFTDADCIVPKNWLHSNNEHLKENVDMIVGYSPEENKSAFVSFMNKANGIIFGAPIGAGIPFSCSGRYFSLSRVAYDAVQGYDKIKTLVSGDDKALLVLVKKAGFKINYNPDVKIKTKAVDSNFVDQQKRRYGKIKMSSFGYKIMQILILISYLYFPFSFAYQPYLAFSYIMSVWILWGLFCVRHHEKVLLKEMFFLLFWPYYVIYFGTLGTITKWTWK